MGSILLRIGIIAAIAGGFWIFRDQLTGNAGDLSVGDCFDVPEAQGDIKDVQHHPCSDLHSGEVIFVGDLTGQTTYPTEDVIEDFVFNTCVPAYNSYTGARPDDRRRCGPAVVLGRRGRLERRQPFGHLLRHERGGDQDPGVDQEGRVARASVAGLAHERHPVAGERVHAHPQHGSLGGRDLPHVGLLLLG